MPRRDTLWSEQRIAILLRGRIGAGKTTVGRIIRKQFDISDDAFILLDQGWGRRPPDDWRRRARDANRYYDLANQSGRPIVLIELSWGEDATLNPREWLDLLEAQGRSVLYFRLVVSLRTSLARMIERGETPHLEDPFLHMPEREPRWINFADRARLQEIEIDHETASAKETATKIANIVKERYGRMVADD
jgi:hypothetical protein